MGRPPLPPAERRSVHFSIRVTKAEHKALVRMAKAEGVTVNKIIHGQIQELLEGEQ